MYYLSLVSSTAKILHVSRYFAIISLLREFFSTKMISPESYAFTVSSDERHQDRNKAIIRVTGTSRR